MSIPDGPFVHVFDETALDLVMRELDTVSDFVGYLIQRETAIRGGRVLHAASEADLLALYLQNVDEGGEHFFPVPTQHRVMPDYQVLIASGEYSALVRRPEYLAKKTADEPSYIWDRLIRVFTEHIIAGTSVEIAGELPDAARAEPALRIMARENRATRRGLGEAFGSALHEAARHRHVRFARLVLPNSGSADPEAGYLFLVLAYPTALELKDGYAQYRRTRVAMLETHCLVALHDNRRFKRMVGIALDASSCVTGREGGSEDLLAIEITEWTPELERRAEESRRHFDVLDARRTRFGRYSFTEYPHVDAPAMSRQQRRALARKARKQRR
jgi:hypothetical protein